jgi:hypothetical protein
MAVFVKAPGTEALLVFGELGSGRSDSHMVRCEEERIFDVTARSGCAEHLSKSE